MDAWELAKVVARRWWTFLPLAVLTLLMTTQVDSRIAPEYQTTASILLVGPFQTVPEVEDQVTRAINPYLAQGIGTTANAMKVVLESQESRQKVIQAGGSNGYSIKVQSRTPIMSISVATGNRDLSIKTAALVTDLLNQELKARQDAFKAPEQSHITTQTLDAVGSVATIRNGLKQIRVVIVAIGLSLAVAASVLANALLAWWSRRRTTQLLRRASTEEAQPVSEPRHSTTVL